MVITGGASEIGIETTRTYAEIGADVTVAVRNPPSATRVVEDLVAATGNGNILFSPVIFDDLAFHFMPYSPVVAYGQSKTATALFAVAATARWAPDGITSNAVMPGAIATRRQRHTGGLQTPAGFHKTQQQDAATTLFAATSPLLEGIGGRYLEDVTEAPVVQQRDPMARGVAPYALDPTNAERLWDVSEALLA